MLTDINWLFFFFFCHQSVFYLAQDYLQSQFHLQSHPFPLWVFQYVVCASAYGGVFMHTGFYILGRNFVKGKFQFCLCPEGKQK